MTHFTDDDIVRIGRGVRDRSLPKAEWTHAAHFAWALWLLTRPDGEARREAPALIRAYNEATGVLNTDASGYHETITQASLRMASAALATNSGAPLSEVLSQLLASPAGRSDWLLAHWSRPVLFSAEARRTWVEPDLSPLSAP